jgi:hypothetical protein
MSRGVSGNPSFRELDGADGTRGQDYVGNFRKGFDIWDDPCPSSLIIERNNSVKTFKHIMLDAWL